MKSQFGTGYAPVSNVHSREDYYWIKIEVRDGKDGSYLGEIGDWVDCSYTFSSDPSSAEGSTITIPPGSPWARFMSRADKRIILVHILLYRGKKNIRQWTGRVDRTVRSVNENEESIRVELVSDKLWLQYIMCFSAPFASINVQIPKVNIKVGPAIHIMKQEIASNLIRITRNRESLFDAPASVFQDDSSKWGQLQELMYPVTVLPTPRAEDKSPTTALSIRMTPAEEVLAEVCNDYNLLTTVSFYVPGRDPQPRIPLSKPGIYIDIVDKDKQRTEGSNPSGWNIFVNESLAYIRGLFGRFDVPDTIDGVDPEKLKDFFGRYSDAKWVVFRDSQLHWNEREYSSYAPRAHTSISGGKTQEFLNKGIELLVNTAINYAFASIGVGFIGNLITGELDDILFAYQRVKDKGMKEELGTFTLFEEYIGKGATAYSLDAMQQLRQARYSAVGYRTATFSGDRDSFAPFLIFEDFDLLDPIGWEDKIEGKIMTERIKAIQVSANRESGVQFSFSMGEEDRPEDYGAVQQRQSERFTKAINSALNAD